MRRGLQCRGLEFSSSKPIPLLLQCLGEGFILSPTTLRWLGPQRCWRPGDGPPPLWRSYSVQEAFKSGQDGSKSAMIASKMPLGWYKSSQVTSKSSKMPSRPPLGPEKSKKNIKQNEITEDTTKINMSAKWCQEQSGRV